MKKLLYFSAILLISISTTHAQEVELDLLKAPVSPASNLLGFAQSEIDKPTDVTDFMATIQSASDNFSKLPSNFAIDIAPFWLTKSKSLGDISTVGLQNSYGGNVIPQTLVLSFAVKNVDSTTVNYNANSTYAGFGFKFHIYRGNYDTKTQEKLNQIVKLQQKKLELMKNNSDQVYDNLSEEILELRKKREKLFDGIDTDDDSPENLQLIELLSIRAGKIDAEIEEKIEKLLEQNESTEEVSSLDEKVKAIASDFQLTRIGFTWDFAGGISGEFQNKSFNQGKIYNAGIWTTFGYTTEKAGAFLGLVRYLNNPERIFALDNTINELNSVSTFDMGFRYILGGTQSKFNASLEAVYRSYLSDFEADNSWRLILNLDYAIVKNQKITFSFGKNYDGTTTKDGNLVAALGTVFGFGNKR